MIYAIRAKGTEFVKIGYSRGFAGGVERRLKLLQTGCPHELEVLAVCNGDVHTERHIHNMLLKAGIHHRGEWFKSCPRLDDVVRWIRDRVFEKDTPRASIIPMRQAHKHKRLGAALAYADIVASR